MNILLASDSYLPHAGGSRVYYHNLYTRLVKTFADNVTILTREVPGWEAFDEHEVSGALQVIRHGHPLQALKYLDYLKIARPLLDSVRLVGNRQIDVFHAGDLYPQAAIGAILKRWYDVPYLAYCHGEQITMTECYRYQPLLRNWLYRQADAVVVNSAFTRERVLEIGIPAARVHTLTPGVDCWRFRPAERSDEWVRRYALEGKTVLLTVARLVARKGHALVLRAIGELLKDFPDLYYLIVGRGPEERNLRQLAAELRISDAVVFAGFVPEQELTDAFNCCDIFVMPNFDEAGDIEGFGMVFLEAGACGKPVIGGRSGGTADAISDGTTGCLVNQGDVSDLCDVLRRLLVSPGLRRRMGSAGVLRAQTQFDWQSRAEALHRISDQILGKSLDKAGRPADISNGSAQKI